MVGFAKMHCQNIQQAANLLRATAESFACLPTEAEDGQFSTL
jgi:hypothetical protein